MTDGTATIVQPITAPFTVTAAPLTAAEAAPSNTQEFAAPNTTAEAIPIFSAPNTTAAVSVEMQIAAPSPALAPTQEGVRTYADLQAETPYPPY